MTAGPKGKADAQTKRDPRMAAGRGPLLPVTGVLDMAPPEQGDYYTTLAEWGGLPRVIALPDAANFLGKATGQNAKALLKLLGDAVFMQEIPCWGRSSSEAWVPDMIRFWTGPMRTQVSSDQGIVVRRDELPQTQTRANLHVEAMGIAPLDALGLLKKRGRRIPSQLLELLSPTDKGADGAVTEKAALVHRTGGRRDLLTPVIEAAQQGCTDPLDTAAVWAQLERLATDLGRPAPLEGVNSGGIHYRNGKNTVVFTKRALEKRLARARAGASDVSKPR